MDPAGPPRWHAAGVPDGPESEEDRHRIFGALVAKLQEEGDLAGAVTQSANWLEKASEDKKADVQAIVFVYICI